MTYESITYKSNPDNTEEVVKFIGDIPECDLCGGHGEYETEYGPRGCDACNSRCIPLIDHTGNVVYVDWNETIEKHPNGLHVLGEEYET